MKATELIGRGGAAYPDRRIAARGKAGVPTFALD